MGGANLWGGFVGGACGPAYGWSLWEGLWVELWEGFRRGQPTWKT